MGGDDERQAWVSFGQQALDVRFSRDGRQLVSAADDGTILLRRLPRLPDAATTTARLRCRVPFQVVDGRLINRPTTCER